MLKTTPTGTLTVIDSVPGLSVGMVSPWIWVASPAASRSRLEVRNPLKPAQSGSGADLLAHGLDELGRALVHDVGGLEQDGPPLARARLRPRHEGGGC